MYYSGISQIDVRSIFMKRHQLQLGNVRATLWRLGLGVTAMLLLAFAVACAAPTPMPTPTPTPTATATPTPAPTATATPTPAPTATPTPVPDLITASPEEGPQAFLKALPASELDCLEQTFGDRNLLEVIGTQRPSSEDSAKLRGCISEETARRLMLGGIITDSGIGELSITCINTELKDVSFLDNLLPQGEPSTQGQTFGFQLSRAMLTCLSEEEAARFEILGAAEDEGGPTVEQLKCLYESADDETLVQLFAMAAAAGSGVGDPPPPEILEIVNRCGLPWPSPGEGGGPPELIQEQQTCVIEAIGETAFSELFTGQRPPTPEELQKIEACGVPLGSDPGEGGGPPELTPEQQVCVTEAIGETAFTELFSGQRAPTQEELQMIEACGVPIGPDSGEEGGPPELTPEQQVCVIQAIGETALRELSTGQRPATPEEIQKIEACVVPIGSDSGEEGDQPVLSLREICVIAAIGETAAREIFTGQRQPTPEEIQMIEECGVTSGPDLGEEGGTSELIQEQQICVLVAIGETAVRELFGGQRPPTPDELQKIEACGVRIGPGSGE